MDGNLEGDQSNYLTILKVIVEILWLYAPARGNFYYMHLQEATITIVIFEIYIEKFDIKAAFKLI